MGLTLPYNSSLNPNAFNKVSGVPVFTSVQPRPAPSTNINGDAAKQLLQGAANVAASTGTGTSGTISTASTVDPATAAFLAGQINNVNTQLGALDPQLQTGLANIQDSYNSGLNKENDAFGRANRDYTTGRTNTIQDELTAKNNIDTGIRSNTNAIQRLLGLSGSGNSSASEVLAPFAANRAGDIQRSGVQTSYGRNLQGLDTAWGDTQSSHNNNLTDLSNQNFANTNSLKSKIADTRASLLQTLAGLTMQQDQAAGKSLSTATADAQPLLNQINDIVKGTAALGSQYANPITLAAPSVYTAPSLASYDFGSTGAPTLGSSNTNTDTTTFNPLFGTPQRKSLLGV